MSTEPCDCCPHKMIEIDKHTDGAVILKRLCRLIELNDATVLAWRHLSLMYHYFGLRNEGIRIKDIPYLTIILEFFSLNLEETPQYGYALWNSISFFQKNILLERYSDNLTAEEYLRDLFSGLGNCLIYVKSTEYQIFIIEALFKLLDKNQSKSNEISVEIRQEAVQNSQLAKNLSFLLQSSSKDIYSAVLDLMLQLCTYTKCVNDFIEMDAIQVLFQRLPLSENLSRKELYIKEQTSNLIWGILRCATNKGQSNPNLKHDFTTDTVINLRKWFQTELLNGRTFQRNNVAALILQFALVNPNLNIASFGLLEDICLLSVATEFGLQGTWAENVQFFYTNEDLNFKKILISCIVCLCEQPIVRLIVKNSAVMGSLVLFLSEKSCPLTNKWTKDQLIDLLYFSLHIIPVLAEFMVSTYTQCGATERILCLIDTIYPSQKNFCIVKSCLKSLFMLIVKGLPLTHFIEMKTVPLLLDLCNYLLSQCKLSSSIQITLMLSFNILSELLQGNSRLLETYSDETKELSLKILHRLQRPQPSDTKIDNRFIISAGDFVWQSTIVYKSKTYFIDNEGVYFILDIIEKVPFPIQLFFMGMLADTCVDRHSITQLVTWRSKKEGFNTLHLLCSLWRIQENKKNVLRDENSCIQDIEFPLMGEKQKFVDVLDSSYSPALMDLLACMRPKVAAVIHVFISRFNEEAQIAKDIYNIPFDTLTTKDVITLHIIQYYEELKQGELWWEIQKYLQDKEMSVLPIDMSLIHSLAMKHFSWAIFIKQNQMKAVNDEQKKEKEYEEELIKEIRLVNLNKFLITTHKLDKYLYMTDKNYIELKRAKRADTFKNLRKRFAQRKKENCHFTFNHPRDLGMVKTGRNQHIRSIATYAYKKFMDAKRRYSLNARHNLSF